LANLKHGRNEGITTSGSVTGNLGKFDNPKEAMLRGFHQSEIERVQEKYKNEHETDGHDAATTTFRRRYKQQQQGDSSLEDERRKHILLSAQSHLRDIDPVTGLPRENLGTMGLKNHPGMVKISPWSILYQYFRQIFKSKWVLIFVLGFVLLLNLRRFGVLFQIHQQTNATTIKEK
jgi:hypothetical protein